MRILHVCPEELASSGIAGYGVGFRTGLTRAGVQIDLVPALSGPPTLANIRRYCHAVVTAGREYDIVHAEFGGGDLHRFWAARAATRAGLRTCMTLHDPPRGVWWPFHTAGAARWARPAAWLRKYGEGPADRVERRLVADADAVFVLSQMGRDAAAEVFGHAEKIHPIPYPVDADHPGATVAAHAPLQLGFFGFWYPGKGLETLLLALAVLANEGRPVSTVLAGQPSPTLHPEAGRAYQATIDGYLDTWGLRDHVTVRGYLDHADLHAMLRGCHATVLPYPPPVTDPPLRSSSASMFEALSLGVPVVGFNVRSLSETLRDGDNGLLVDDLDHHALAAAIRRLDDDPALRARIQAGAAATAETLSTLRTGTRAREIYESVMAS